MIEDNSIRLPLGLLIFLLQRSFFSILDVGTYRTNPLNNIKISLIQDFCSTSYCLECKVSEVFRSTKYIQRNTCPFKIFVVFKASSKISGSISRRERANV